MKKIIALVLALALVLASCAVALAADETPDYSITVTNTNPNISIAGKEYTAYKLFDATYNGDAVSYSIEKENYFYKTPAVKAILDTYFTFTAAAGDDTIMTVTPKDGFDAAAARVLADKLQPYFASATPAGSKTVAAGEETATIAVAGPGYYIVDGSAIAAADDDDTEIIAALALTTAKPAATVNPKADAPSVDKTITGIAGGTTKVEESGKEGNGSVGDKVEYKLESKVPDMTGYKAYSFVYTDTMSKGLSFNNDVVVTIDGTTIPAAADKVDGQTYYTLATAAGSDNATVITITFSDFIKQAAKKGKDIVITYSATISEEAVEDGVEVNTVTLKYSHNPYDAKLGLPDEVLGETPESKTWVYTTNIELLKVAADGSTKLVGAKFSITGNSSNVSIVNKEIFKESASGTYYRLTNGTYTTTAPTDATKDQYDSTTVKYEKVTEVDKTAAAATGYAKEGWVDANSILSFNGLGEGTYTITELVSPQGYNLLKDPISVVVTFDAVNKKFTATVDSKEATVEGNTIKLTVKNATGTELPHTGGIGTTIFYILGGLLVVGAAVILVARRKAQD